MKVDNFSYKTEFQDKGAGHVHWTLWVKLHTIVALCKIKEDNRLVTLSKDQRKQLEGKFTEPFRKITHAFKKFKNGGVIDPEEEKAVVNFVDQFTTVSLCEDEVGKEIVKIVEEVNVHHHTKTCRKNSPKCRFRYPKFPVWKTILVRPHPKWEFAE